MNVNSAYTPEANFSNSAARNQTTIGIQRQDYAQPLPANPQNQPGPAVTVDLSPESRLPGHQVRHKPEAGPLAAKKPETGAEPEKSGSRNAKDSSSLNKLSPEEQRQVNDLKKRDAEVKAHEQAHIAAGGAYVRGGASYEYEQGPDHQSYAVGGEVSIDTSAENTPEATIRKMQVVKRAALAPQKPSGQDRSVAAQAAQAEARARIELRQEKSQDAAAKKEKKAEENAESGTRNNPSSNLNDNSNSDPLATVGRGHSPQASRTPINHLNNDRIAQIARNSYQSAAGSVSFTDSRPAQPNFTAFA